MSGLLKTAHVLSLTPAHVWSLRTALVWSLNTAHVRLAENAENESFQA